ncbi:uncharacterized protein LOC126375134 [Pectinophora gossypiella]|uniref:uncharacterized protein LOC126375134 n=1 Tax=Pectinophora gossypiella TaxID=13191 RepID=UPI00214E6FFA|nr:uncharacterized protein LOC126375134 [Pectinophora gossypiella]
MNRKSSVPPSKMVAKKSKNKVLSCSTPENRSESPSRDSDSLCDSEAASPVPFLCTQDGAEGETDVVWNFYTPKSDHAPSSRLKDTTPLSRKSKKVFKSKIIEKPLPKRKLVRASQKKSEIFQDLIELNQNLHELIAKKTSCVTEKPQSGSEEDIFSDSRESSPKSGLRTNSRCLRRNVLSAKFPKPENDTALESDDSLNECLIKASQVVEEKLLNCDSTPAKRPCFESSKIINHKSNVNLNMDNDSMDAILNNIKLDSPLINRAKKFDSPKLNNDSFDSLVGNLNDSALDRLTQMPVKNNVNRSTSKNSNTDWTIEELTVHDGSPLNKSCFGRHNSMPESPSLVKNKPSTSGMAFGRHNSMPYHNNVSGDSPIKCTPDEIKKKHQLAREKLMAKRLLPFTTSQQPGNTLLSTQTSTRKPQFKPKVVSSTVNKLQNLPASIKNEEPAQISQSVDIKLLIEKKRQEALMKLRSRHHQNKT